jgi:hypothetical protein
MASEEPLCPFTTMDEAWRSMARSILPGAHPSVLRFARMVFYAGGHSAVAMLGTAGDAAPAEFARCWTRLVEELARQRDSLPAMVAEGDE